MNKVLARAARVVLCCALAIPPVLVAGPADALPSKEQWLKDVRHAMAGSRAYLRDQVQRDGDRLAINLDIDNTALATHYAPGHPVKVVRRLALYASRHGVAVLFNTGRTHRKAIEARRLLRRAGYPITELCWRRDGQALAASKQRCRRHFVREGYRIVANIGNRRTDFVGGNYRRAFRLPNYGNRLS